MPTHHSEDPTSKDALESLYKRCLEEIQKRLDQTATLTVETFLSVTEAVRESLGKTREVRQADLDQVIDTIVARWQQVRTHGEHVRETFQQSDEAQTWIKHGRSLLAHLAGTVKTLASEVESHLQGEQEYHTGTVVGTGNFFCTQCDKEIRKVKTGPLPPCSRCHGTVFRRHS